MIDAYVYTTPNGFKALIGLEELGLPYITRWVDITKGQQLEQRPAFARALAMKPAASQCAAST